jgi:tRNA threonylcarbamoyladenosine biosynthesis protein TsaB
MSTDLLLDTSTDTGLLSLWRGGELLEERHLKAGFESSKTIFPSIREILASHDLSVRDVNRWIAGIGPGSFTGVRVAVSIVQTLAFACGREWYGVSSLALWVPSHEGRFLSVFDARSGGLYCQFGERSGDTVRMIGPPQRYLLQEISQLLADEPCVVVTPTPERIRERLSSCITVEGGLPTGLFVLKEDSLLCSPSIEYGQDLWSRSCTQRSEEHRDAQLVVH